MCHCTTPPFTFMYSSFGNHCTNFIDDFGKAEIQEQSYDAFCAFGTLLAAPGLDSSPEKESPPATSMVFLGIFVHIENMTVSIAPDCLQELYHRCSFLSVDKVSCTDLQSFLWVMSFVNACVTCTAHTLSFKITLKCHSLGQIHLFFYFKCFPWYYPKNITKWHWTSVAIKNNIHLFTAQWIKKELFYDSMQHLTLNFYEATTIH